MYIMLKYASLVFVAILFLLELYVRKYGKDRVYNGKLIKLYDTCIALIDKYWLVILIVLFAVFMFTRFYALDIVPL